MSKSLSKEYISESDLSGSEESVQRSGTPGSDTEYQSAVEEQLFEPPSEYIEVKKFEHLPNLENKEIWLIKASEDFDFSQLKSIPVSFNPLESGPEFMENSKTYTIQEDGTNLATNLSDDKNLDSKYSILESVYGDAKLKHNPKLKIKRIFNINETVKIPDIEYGKIVKKRKNVPVVHGLKVQHHATGYSRTQEDAEYISEGEYNEKNDGDTDSKANSKLATPKKEKKQKKEKKIKKELKKEKKHKKAKV